MVIRSKAPLRLGLGGGGTDLGSYCDNYVGFTLNSTISLYVHCTLEERQDGMILFDSIDTKTSEEIKCSQCLVMDGHMNLYKAIYNRIVKDYSRSPLSFSLHTYSDVPVGSGLGGSSTLVVAIIKCFVEWLHLPLGEYEIAKLAIKIEREDAGIIGGAQDQYAAVFGGFNYMEYYNQKKVIVNPLRIKKSVIYELEDSLILYFTNITRDASQIEQEKKNLKNNIKSVDAMHKVKDDAILMKQSLLIGDLNKFSFYLGKSWKAKKEVCDKISNPEIDNIYNIAIENGAYSGKVSGAGGGGFMFFMVNPKEKMKIIGELNKQKGYTVNFCFTKNGANAWKVKEQYI